MNMSDATEQQDSGQEDSGKSDKGLIRKDRLALAAESQVQFGSSSLEGLSCGYYWVDYVGGDEGFLIPLGGVTEVAGLQQAGKTTLLLELIAYNQKLARDKGREFKVLWVDYERCLLKQLALAKRLGVVFDDNFTYITPITLEGGAQFIIERCRANTADQVAKRPDLVVIDTAAAARPAVEYKNKIGQTKQPGIRGRLWAEFYRNIVPELEEGGPAVVVINQIFVKLDISGRGNPHAPPEYDTPGSNALKFYAVARLFLTGAGMFTKKMENPYTYEVTETPVAGITEIRGEKTKFGNPFRTAKWINFFGQGIDPIHTIVAAAIRKGEKTKQALVHVYQKGARFDVLKTPGDENSAMGLSVLGKLNFGEELKKNEEALQVLCENLNPLFQAQFNAWKTSAKQNIIFDDSTPIKESMGEVDAEALRLQFESEKNEGGKKKYTSEEIEELVQAALEQETSDKI